MSQLDDACALPSIATATPTLAGGTRGLVRWVCTNNPFYVLSALLVLVGLWISFGAQIRDEQTWALMSGMAAYTLLLAVPACLLVRFGNVWEDVRTVLLLVVLMFLATSVTFDESLARSPAVGVDCYLAGFMFAVAVSEGILRATRMALPRGFRVPYYLFLAQFFLYPIALVPLLDRPRGEPLQWALFAFSPVAGLITLSLLPAVRRGAGYVRENGTPWRWPLYPWALFVFLGFGVAARSFLLCWSMQHVERTDPERFIFGPYFLVPFLLAVAVLLLEIGLVSRSRRTLRVALALPLGLIALTLVGDRPDDLYQGFLSLFVARLGGTPFYLTSLAVAGFYAYAALRRVPTAVGALSVSAALLAVVGPGTRDLNGLVELRAWPLLALAALQLGLGLRRRDSWRCLLAGACLFAASTCGAISPRGPIAFHLALALVMTIGAAFDDRLGRWLRNAGPALALLACASLLSGRLERSESVPAWVLTAYPPMMAALLAAYGQLLRHPPSRVAATLALTAWLVALGWETYGSLRQVILGLDFIATGLVLLALAELISLAKAGLLPGRTLGGKGKLPDPSE